MQLFNHEPACATAFSVDPTTLLGALGALSTLWFCCLILLPVFSTFKLQKIGTQLSHVLSMDRSREISSTIIHFWALPLGDNKLTEELMDLQSRRPEGSEGNAPKRVKLEVALKRLKRVKHEAD